MKKYLDVLKSLGLSYDKKNNDYLVFIEEQKLVLNFFYDWREEGKARVKTGNFDRVFPAQKSLEHFLKEIIQKRRILKKVEEKVKNLAAENGIPVFYDTLRESWIVGSERILRLDLEFDEKWKYQAYFGPVWNHFTKMFYPEQIMEETNVLTEDIEKLENIIMHEVEKAVKKERLKYLFN